MIFISSAAPLGHITLVMQFPRSIADVFFQSPLKSGFICQGY